MDRLSDPQHRLRRLKGGFFVRRAESSGIGRFGAGIRLCWHRTAEKSGERGSGETSTLPAAPLRTERGTGDRRGASPREAGRRGASPREAAGPRRGGVVCRDDCGKKIPPGPSGLRVNPSSAPLPAAPVLLSPAGCGWSAAAGVRAQKCGISLSGLPQEEVTAQRTLPELFLVLQEEGGGGGRLQEFDPVRGAFGHERRPGHVRNLREILFMGEGRGFPAFTWHRPRPRADRRLFSCMHPPFRRHPRC